MSVRVTVVRPVDPEGVSVVRIETNGSSKGSWYLVCEVPCDIGGKAWSVLRLGSVEPYHVRIGAPDVGDQCDCRGFLGHGYCRHVSAIRALSGAEGGTWSVTTRR